MGHHCFASSSNAAQLHECRDTSLLQWQGWTKKLVNGQKAEALWSCPLVLVSSVHCEQEQLHFQNKTDPCVSHGAWRQHVKATCSVSMWTYRDMQGKRKEGRLIQLQILWPSQSFYLHCIWYLWKSALSYNQSFIGFRFTLYTLHIMYIIKNKGKKIGHETLFTLIQYWCKIWNWIDSSLLPSSICAVQQYPQCLVSSHQALQTQRRRTNRSGTHKWKMNMMIWYEKKATTNSRCIMKVGFV